MKQKNNLSLIVAWLVCLAVLLFHFILPKYDYDFYTKEVAWDVTSYYLYLPLFFIHHDLAIQDYSIIQHAFDQYHFSTTFYQAFKTENGNWVMMYTMGLALLYLPFFLAGHLWAIAGGYPADGLSFPYQFCVSTGVMFYIVAGIFLSRKVLLYFFSEKTTSIVLVLLLLGTNYFHEAIQDNMMPHAILFTGYALVILYTIRWHDNPRLKYAGILGLVIGFMTMTRPTEILSILIPLLWNVHDKSSFVEKMNLIKQKFSHLLILIICIVIAGVPQMIYWKKITGSWIFNSYQNVPGFDFTEPHIIELLFSFKKSWFIYTPMIILPLAGLYLLQRYARKANYAIVFFVCINFYLLSNLPGWWNGGSFGLRYMVQSYAVMAIPFGAFLQWMSERRMILKLLIATAAVLFLFLNLFQTWQYTHWIIPADGMTGAYYKKIFLRTHVDTEDKELLEYSRTYDPNEKFTDYVHYKKKTIGYFDMDSVNTGYLNTLCTDTVHALSGKNSYRLSPPDIYSPGPNMTYAAITPNDHAWLRASVCYFPVHDLKENPASLVVSFSHKGKSYGYRAYDLEREPFKLNAWNKISVDYLTPYPYSSKDVLNVYVWLRGGKELYIDDLKVEAYEKK